MTKAIRDWVTALCFAVLAAVIFRTWLYAPYSVPTSSMVHTIEKGDHVFVNKHAYGFYLPFTDNRLFSESINRGDIIVFPYPLDPNIEYIKRVIGVAGDSIEIIGETVFLNDEEEKSSYVYLDPTLLSLPEAIKVTVPEGKLWVMGDNRRNSKDSRYWGFVDESTVVGKATYVFWSHNPENSLMEGYSFNRIGTKLY